jgi:hypothetical protein
VQDRVGSTSEIYVADVFLEEIYLHRANSIKTFEELRLDKLENLKAFVSYFGPANTNVYRSVLDPCREREESPPVL